jgi:FkbM family methyltransferase
VIQIEGVWWPDDVGESWKHALLHVKSSDWAVRQAPRRRVALQAGGNVGLWPTRLAKAFDRVITFEPDPIARECLIANVPASVEVHAGALGAQSGQCSIKHRGLGSHRVVDGDTVPIDTIDALELRVLDYLQLDIEGYEQHALMGGVETIRRCKPIVQVELRGFATKYGTTTDDTVKLLTDLGYREVSRQPGSDVVFQA